jgi:hypothetical protein
MKNPDATPLPQFLPDQIVDTLFEHGYTTIRKTSPTSRNGPRRAKNAARSACL